MNIYSILSNTITAIEAELKAQPQGYPHKADIDKLLKQMQDVLNNMPKPKGLVMGFWG